MSVPYYTTKESFEVMRKSYSSEKLRIKQKVWLKRFYAFCSENFAVSEKQLNVVNDICEQAGFNFEETVSRSEHMERSNELSL